MPEDIRRIDYYYTSVPDKPGEGGRVLAALQGAGVNRLASRRSRIAPAGRSSILSRKTAPFRKSRTQRGT
jgi:hypothetical protein